MPLISIIIPVYNVEQYLSKCLDSVLVDNQFAGQVICVNDGSTDGSLTILEGYTERYRNVEIISQPNAGLSEARNTGLRAAKGDYVMFIDSDDWLFPDTLNKLVERIDGEDVIYFNARVYSEGTQSYGSDIAIPNIKNMDGQEYFAIIHDKSRNMPCVCVCGGVYNRLFLKENSLYNEPGIYHEDNYFTPQVLLEAKKVSSINEYVYVYRIRKGSITAHVTEKHIKDLLFIARNLYAKYEQIESLKDAFYQDVCQIYINMINAAFDNNIALHKLWKISDSQRMLRCALDNRSRRIARLTYVSPRLAYRYMKDEMPSLMRRMINRWL